MAELRGTACWFGWLVLGVAVAGGVAPASAQGDFVVGQVVEVVSGGTASGIPAGECRVVDMTAWINAIDEIPLTTTVELGPDKARLACEFAWERIESQAQERCATNYADASLYRNGRLLPVTQSFSDCRCTEGLSETSCTLATAIQCGFEALQTQQIRVCNK